MRLSLRKSLLLASIAFGLSVAGVVLTSGLWGGNNDAATESLSRLDAESAAKAAKLVAAETTGMTRNEESGIVYYHSPARTGEANRIYLLWSMAGPRSQTYSTVVSALSKEKLDAPKAVGVAVYVDFGFYSFRSKYGMMLTRAFRDIGLGGLRGACYQWDDKLNSWAYVAELPNDVVIALLTPDQKRAILGGTYNMVSAAELKELK